MYTIIEIKQQGTQVHVRTNPPGGGTVSGKLVRRKGNRFVVLFNGHYDVYEAPIHRIASISASQWPMKKSQYI